ncbi:PREDICTED: voltage-dependent calcium channel gamma-1 subunit [Dipodomys ordii]|uniref:Voltage-dependent calcium channel gamma-1 subunit n=1 Tax=Dipodomys ordii TaxID=10020 RepID=A0A1S3GVT9_DIPOR|nr:PREDICTED: voltage-dependent calcium channel gamma-1 subunit [Dipodomys ordii]
MSQTQAAKVRVTLFCILVGTVLATVAVVTDHWAVLSPHLEQHNVTCEAAHFGLWRICTTRVAVDTLEDKSCGHAMLSREKNCSYFRHFNPGESSEIFEFTTQRVLSSATLCQQRMPMETCVFALFLRCVEIQYTYVFLESLLSKM